MDAFNLNNANCFNFANKKCKILAFYIDFTPTHMGTSSQPYNLNQVQRELDFHGSSNNLIRINKYNSNILQNPMNNNINNKPNNLTTLLSNNTLSTVNNNFGSQNNIQNMKSLSFCGPNTPNPKTPTIIKTNTQINNNYEKMKSYEDPKFSMNNKEEQPLDHKINLENILIGKDKRTTVMLRNIPNKYTLQNLVDEVNISFFGKYDYINLPIDYEVNIFLIIFREN